MNKILEHLRALYGDEVGRATFRRIQALIADCRERMPRDPATPLTERDAVLITYGDQVREPGRAPLQTLVEFCAQHLEGVVSSLHLLPFYPYSSDDGFSVLDYCAVNPALGDWEDVARLGGSFRLMFDAVVNHVSSQSVWFQGFLRDDPRYREYFIVLPAGTDLSAVIRPRTSPVLTPFRTPSGVKHVWTTFSADQIDLDYHNPVVLLEIVETLLFYLERGATLIRLDAIAFLWKQVGTTCLHLPQTHRIIQLFRAIVDQVAPGVLLITETNVPHAENLSYFGDGTNEAHLIYNFALPPLTLHAFHTGDVRVLASWARALALPSRQVTFFNFLASHDGIGLNPARGLLSDAEIAALVTRAQEHGGRVSYKSNGAGVPSPYELNISYFDALSNPNAGEPLALQVDRFIGAHAIALSLVGLPGLYFHSLFGSRSWPAGVEKTGHNRAINREKLARAALERELADATSRRAQVFGRLAQLLRARGRHPAFNPFGEMRVLDGGASVLAVLRSSPDGDDVLCLQNVSDQPQVATLDWRAFPARLLDLVTGDELPDAQAARLAPYQTRWLTKSRSIR